MSKSPAAPAATGITELVDLEGTGIGPPRQGGGKRVPPIAAKAQGDQPTLAEACRKVGIALPDRPEPPRRGKRAKVTAKLLPGR